MTAEVCEGDERWLHFAERVFAAASDPQQGWRPALEALVGLLEAPGAFLLLCDPGLGRLVRYEAVGMDVLEPSAQAPSLAGPACSRGPCPCAPVGGAAADREKEGTRLLSTWLEMRSPRRALVAVRRCALQGAFGAVERALLERATRPLRDALEVDARLHAECDLREALDRAPLAMLLLDARGGILEASARARELLERRAGVGADQGRLRCLDARDEAALLAVLGRCAGDVTRRGAGGIVRVRRSDAARPLVVSVTAAASGEAQAQVPGAAALVLLIDPDAARLPADLVARLHGLSSAEALLTCLIVSGMTLTEAAAQLGVSVNTAKTQLQSVFAKTGCHSQSELIRTIASGPAMHWAR